MRAPRGMKLDSSSKSVRGVLSCPIKLLFTSRRPSQAEPLPLRVGAADPLAEESALRPVELVVVSSSSHSSSSSSSGSGSGSSGSSGSGGSSSSGSSCSL